MTIKTALQRTTSASLALTLVLISVGMLALSVLSGDAYEIGGLLLILGLFSVPVSLLLIAGVGVPPWLSHSLATVRPVISATIAIIGVLMKFAAPRFFAPRNGEPTAMKDKDETEEYKDYTDWFGFNNDTGKYEVKGPDGHFTNGEPGSEGLAGKWGNPIL